MDKNYTRVEFENLDLKTREAVKIRGYFANKYKENELAHNHRGDKFIYKYPEVQYKVIDGTPMVCGIDEGAKFVTNLGLDTNTINIEGRNFEIFQKKIVKEKKEFSVTDRYIEYKFLTPWIALNQNNSKAYEKANEMEKEEMMKKILVANILSMAKGLNYNVEKQIYSWIDLDSLYVNFKNLKMKAFVGRIKVNFIIPDYLGLGKSVARGFGTIKQIK